MTTTAVPAFDRLVAAFQENFTDTQLHAFIIAAGEPDNRGTSGWGLLRKAAIAAADCIECDIRTGF